MELKRPELSFTTTMVGIVGRTHRFLYFVFWKTGQTNCNEEKKCRVAGNLVIVKN